MSGFSAQWLDLREPLDATSRAAELCKTLTEDLAFQPQTPLRASIIDLGAGTGANLRYAAPLLEGAQDWLFVESDPALRAAVPDRMRGWGQASQILVADQRLVLHGAQFECDVQQLPLNLATQLHELRLPHKVLLTASALLDLVSERWLRALAQRAAQAAATVWFALTYDGSIGCRPAEPEDREVQDLFNLHQRTDKGFGAALGPEAGPLAERLFAQLGYRMQSAPSPWRIGSTQTALQRALIEGWFEAACEIAPHRAAALNSWLARRHAHIDAGRSTIQVGHIDIVGRPPRNGA